MPKTVGIRAEANIHFAPHSFLMVSKVVAQGQWNRQNSIVHMAVLAVHPLARKRARRLSVLIISPITVDDVYAIIMIGITISFAGRASTNARRMTPSSPKSLAKGSKNEDIQSRAETPLTVRFARV